MAANQVIHAEWVDSLPYPTIKPRGRAAEGFAFQRRVHGALRQLESLGHLLYEPCIKYRDDTGLHYCQPDCVLEVWDRVIVVEAKLSLRRYSDARKQLMKRYRPTLSYLYKKPIFVLVAFRFWVPGDFKALHMVTDPSELVTAPKSTARSLYGWHFLG